MLNVRGIPATKTRNSVVGSGLAKLLPSVRHVTLSITATSTMMHAQADIFRLDVKVTESLVKMLVYFVDQATHGYRC